MSFIHNLKKINVIGVDIDNVLSDTDQTIREIIREKFGVESTTEQITSWNYSDSLPISREQERIALNLFHEQYCKFATPISGAASGLRHLYNSYTIWLITSRDSRSELLTKDWLHCNQMFYHKLFFAKDKVNFNKNIDLIIEDNWETASIFAEIGIPAILFQKPWNENGLTHPLISRVDTWGDVVSLVGMEKAERLHLSRL